MAIKRWFGSEPVNCQICHQPFVDVFIDGATQMGPWALMCSRCHAQYGQGLGLGRGQKYSLATRVKLEGNPGAAWHKRMAENSREAHEEAIREGLYKNEYDKGYAVGEYETHEDAARESESLALPNPGAAEHIRMAYRYKDRADKYHELGNHKRAMDFMRLGTREARNAARSSALGLPNPHHNPCRNPECVQCNPGNADAYAQVYNSVRACLDAIAANDIEAAERYYTQAMNATGSFTNEDWSELFLTYPDTATIGQEIVHFIKATGGTFRKSTIPLPNPYRTVRRSADRDTWSHRSIRTLKPFVLRGGRHFEHIVLPDGTRSGRFVPTYWRDMWQNSGKTIESFIRENYNGIDNDYLEQLD